MKPALLSSPSPSESEIRYQVSRYLHPSSLVPLPPPTAPHWLKCKSTIIKKDRGRQGGDSVRSPVVIMQLQEISRSVATG